MWAQACGQKSPRPHWLRQKFLHGRGNGVLRQVVRDYLRTQRAVASLADEHADRGGDGVTVAVLK